MNTALKILLAPAAIVTAPLWIFLIATELYFLPSELFLRYKMKLKGRYISHRQLGDMGSGTLIVDQDKFNFSTSRVWYTADDISDLYPFEQEDPALDEDYVWPARERWLKHQYLNAITGKGLIVAVWHGHNKVQSLKNGTTGIKILESFSGGQRLGILAREGRRQDSGE